MGQISERKRVTLEFFEQLNEPERSEAIENFNEGTSNKTPSCLANAVFFCINWTDSPQGWDYWDKIHESIRDNTYHHKQFNIVQFAYDMYTGEGDKQIIAIDTYNKLNELGKIK